MVLSKNKKRVVVAMSGGVDSSAAAVILQKQGYDCIGVSMKLWQKEFCGRHKPKSCCSTQDLNDARSVAAKLGMPFYALDLSAEFKKEVMDYFCKEYLSGRTPNPCIICNNKIKFGALLKKARELDAEFIATGHYAKIAYSKTKKQFTLKRAKDKSKDQSYVLFGLTQAQLKHVIFPVGGYLKSEVRQICKKANLKTAQKPESQDICFVWDNNYSEFLKSEYGIKSVPGQIVTADGKILGQHPGTIFFTVGQRRGLGLGGAKEPLYVLEIDAKNNRIVVGTKEELNKKVLFADNVNWINGPYAGAVKAKNSSIHLFDLQLF